jgi:hypothetical protein
MSEFFRCAADLGVVYEPLKLKRLALRTLGNAGAFRGRICLQPTASSRYRSRSLAPGKKCTFALRRFTAQVTMTNINDMPDARLTGCACACVADFDVFVDALRAHTGERFDLSDRGRGVNGERWRKQ